MLRRAIRGLLKGLLLGVSLAALLVQGLGVSVFPGVLLAYVSAGLAGVLVGLVAGKPVWARGAAVEAALKAVFGGFLGVVALLVVNRAFGLSLELGPLGTGSVGQLPALVLPLVGAVLGAIFELDNTGEEATPLRPRASTKRRVQDAAGGELDEPHADAERTASGPERSAREGRS